MWISLFVVVLAVAVGLGIGATILESEQKRPRRYPRKRAVRVRG